MLSLVMDTSNQYLAIGLYKDDQCVDQIIEAGSKRQSEYAIPKLEELLEKNHFQLLDVDECILTIGPGSYTGVRVALTIIKTLSVIKDIKVKTISSLHAYAGYLDCVSIIDARSKKVFVCTYKNGQAVTEETLIPIEELDQYNTLNLPYVGELNVINQEYDASQLINNMYLLTKNQDYVDNIDLLVPEYIKEVEAKKACY